MRLAIAVILSPFLFLNCSTDCAVSSTHQLISDTVLIKRDLDSIVRTNAYRNYTNLKVLNKVADYIKEQFKEISDSVVEQKYRYKDAEYKNIICSLNTDKRERIVIGAHYDVCGDQDGADDNASGVAGLLDLARLLKNEKLNYRIDFVAYTLEEPPFFRSEWMGSHIHARYIHENNIPLKGMICLEMIGFFSEKPKSQDYPVGILKWLYGSKGDYIMLVQRFGNGKFGNEIKRRMQKIHIIPTKSFKGPQSLAGVDFSDHLNYWAYDYSAIMITNTSFYRNKNYHEKTDKLETIDLKRLALTIDELYLTLKQLN